jgi:hypothetical protein
MYLIDCRQDMEVIDILLNDVDQLTDTFVKNSMLNTSEKVRATIESFKRLEKLLGEE